MNQRQRIALFIGTLVVAAMLLFPPMSGWRAGYGFLFNKRSTYRAELDLHDPNFIGTGWVSWRINRELLVFQLLILPC
jgi:hypothetical protein